MRPAFLGAVTLLAAVGCAGVPRRDASETATCHAVREILEPERPPLGLRSLCGAVGSSPFPVFVSLENAVLWSGSEAAACSGKTFRVESRPEAVTELAAVYVTLWKTASGTRFHVMSAPPLPKACPEGMLCGAGYGCGEVTGCLRLREGKLEQELDSKCGE